MRDNITTCEKKKIPICQLSRLTDEGKRDRVTEKRDRGEGVCVERIYEPGLSVGHRPGPSVVHSSVISTTPQAPMCLSVAAIIHTHTRMHASTHFHTHLLVSCTNDAREDQSLQENAVTVTFHRCHLCWCPPHPPITAVTLPPPLLSVCLTGYYHNRPHHRYSAFKHKGHRVQLSATSLVQTNDTSV